MARHKGVELEGGHRESRGGSRAGRAGRAGLEGHGLRLKVAWRDGALDGVASCLDGRMGWALDRRASNEGLPEPAWSLRARPDKAPAVPPRCYLRLPIVCRLQPSPVDAVPSTPRGLLLADPTPVLQPSVAALAVSHPTPVGQRGSSFAEQGTIDTAKACSRRLRPAARGSRGSRGCPWLSPCEARRGEAGDAQRPVGRVQQAPSRQSGLGARRVRARWRASQGSQPTRRPAKSVVATRTRRRRRRRLPRLGQGRLGVGRCQHCHESCSRGGPAGQTHEAAAGSPMGKHATYDYCDSRRVPGWDHDGDSTQSGVRGGAVRTCGGEGSAWNRYRHETRLVALGQGPARRLLCSSGFLLSALWSPALGLRHHLWRELPAVTRLKVVIAFHTPLPRRRPPTRVHFSALFGFVWPARISPSPQWPFFLRSAVSNHRSPGVTALTSSCQNPTSRHRLVFHRAACTGNRARAALVTGSNAQLPAEPGTGTLGGDASDQSWKRDCLGDHQTLRTSVNVSKTLPLHKVDARPDEENSAVSTVFYPALRCLRHPHTPQWSDELLFINKKWSRKLRTRSPLPQKNSVRSDIFDVD
ncbi:hypothetical protein Micbo1qcDRAFT_173398 [Microdochium bolleyi]|uniref:Uncharacterized protein n=1 Tax=Microdochium bolleyi TaxID=196109 RepID=A0A136JC16_9PEZI|nr:hypothetical protein Micbo1qcDRAFT_173398 [Microdochium bolleyi]